MTLVLIFCRGILIKIKSYPPFKLCIAGSVNSGLISPDTSSSCLSQQDVLGYATLRSLHRYRRPLYSDTVSLAAMELLMFDEHRHITSSSRSASVSRALKVRSLDRQYVHPG